jgi:LAO/AO transport system kinase
VLVTTASTGAGVPELLAALDRHREAGRTAVTSGARRTRAAAQVQSILADRVAGRLRAPALAARTAAVIDDVAAHRLDPFAAADLLLAAALDASVDDA